MKKTAIVTGASHGIGFAIAKQLGDDGFNIVIMDMNDQEKYQENFDKLSADSVSTAGGRQMWRGSSPRER